MLGLADQEPSGGTLVGNISQVPPNHAESPSLASRLGLKKRASDLVRDQIPEVELRGFEPLTPSMRMRMRHSNGFEPTSAFPVKYQLECQLLVLECVAQYRRLTRNASDK